MHFFVGIDWASEAHAVCLIDHAGRVRWRAMVAHSATGLAGLVQRLRRWRRRGPFAIAVERPSGLLVDTLVQAGFDVVPIHPNVVKATRPRYAAAASKSDPGDAFLLADLLRTDGHRFRPLQPPSDETRALRTLVRGRDDLVAQRVALTNQVRALLERVWPGAAHIFADVASPIALAFLTRYPTAQSAARLGEKRLAHFLVQHGYCGRRSPRELLARLQAAPASPLGDTETEAAGDLVRSLVAVLTPLVAQIQQLGAAIAAALHQHPDAPVVQALPRGGTINAAQILAELGDDRRRFLSPDHLAAEAGVVPVTHASGKHHGVTFRWACNKRLRFALTTFADNSRHASPWAATIYRRALARGCDHPHAIRILARAWVRVLWRCWQDRTPYDVTRHRGAMALAAA
jgi:transposase